MSSSAPNEPDPMMLELFRAEVDTHLPVLSNGLLALEKGSVDRKEIEAMMRAAHSIKGAARIVGIDAAVRVAHAMEDCFTAAKEDRIALSSDAVDILLQGVDTLQRTCVPEANVTADEESMKSVLDSLAAVRDGKTTARPAPPAQVSAAVAVALPEQSLDIALPANLDAPAAESLRSEFCNILSHKPSRIRLDFGRVEQLSAMAVALLLSLAREIKATPPVTVETLRVSPSIRALLRVAGLEHALSEKG